jgi:hypothetical protein
MTVEVIYPNDDDPRDKQPDIFVEVNAYLEAKTHLGEELPTIQGIAEKLGITDLTLRTWEHFDEEFKEGLERFTKLQNINLLDDEYIGNRADAMLLALVLLETKKRHDEEMRKVE